MTRMIYLNGEIVAAEDARISPFDGGFLFGHGIFETMRVYGGRIHLLERHLDRLARGAAQLHIPLPERDVLKDGLARTIEANAIDDGAIRLTLTIGVPIGVLASSASPTLFISSRPLLHTGDPERLVVLQVRRDAPVAEMAKSTSYLTSMLGAGEAAERGVREGIMLGAGGAVAECTASNIFCVIDDELWTPPLELGILAGITRGRVIELAVEAELRVRKERFGLDRLYLATECFITNSLREITPVASVEAKEFVAPGPVTTMLAEAYRREIPMS